VIVDEQDIFGDGVNVAAGLEALAEPGGICVSRVVRDQVRDKLDYTFQDLGAQQVKNIARPVRVYALRLGAVADLPASSVPSAPPISQPTVAPHVSIVVLPFANLSADAEQQYFADGITEDVTTDLSRIPHMFVISRNTAFTYQGKRVDTKQIGRELGVRYVLEGSVRQSGNHVRVNAQLIAAETDAHLWAERFDRDVGDLFAVQDNITRGIASVLSAQLITAEAARPTEHPDVLDNILRGRAAANSGWTPDNYSRTIGFFEQALALDPHSTEAQCLLANMLVNRVLRRQTETAAVDVMRADELVDQVLATSPSDTFGHYVRGQVLRIKGRCLEAIPEFERAIAANPNFVPAYGNLGRCKILTGSIHEVIPLEEQAVRLSPRDPFLGTLYTRIGYVHLLQSRTDEAIVWFKRALLPARPVAMLREVHLHLASAYALNGETERAAFELAEARRMSRGNTFNIAWVKAHQYRADPEPPPSIRILEDRTYFAGLRKAGMPEE